MPDTSGRFVDGVEPRRSQSLAITQGLVGYHLLSERLTREEQLLKEHQLAAARLAELTAHGASGAA